MRYLKHLLNINYKHGVLNYKPLPVILQNAKGIYMYDIYGKRYFDFLSSYSSVNQGHCHPRLVDTMISQCSKMTLCSRAFHSENLIHFYKFIHDTFHYDKCIPMNSGVEGGETAIKLARLWGYENKKVKDDNAIVLMAKNNFWGRTITACSTSTDPVCSRNFGPYTPGFELVDFNCISSLEQKLKQNPNIVAFMVEPIQGEAGIILPHNNYLQNVRAICDKYNVLLIFDEVQTGIGRTGKLLASDIWNIRPDILILGKSLSGGMIPMSAVLANKHIMDLMKPGMHGSTYGGNPLATKIAIEAIKIIQDDHLLTNTEKMGQLFRNSLQQYQGKYFKEIRGIGLLNAIEFYNVKDAQNFITLCLKFGLLCKSNHHIVRLCPPLIITREEMLTSLTIIKYALNNLKI